MNLRSSQKYICGLADKEMSRAPALYAGRPGKPNLMGSNPDLADLNPGRVKPMTLKLILVTS